VKVLYDAVPLLMRSAGVKNYHYAVLQRLLTAVPSRQLRIFPYLSRIGVNVNEQSNFSRAYSWPRLTGVFASNRFRIPFAYPQAAGVDLFHITPHVFHPPTKPVLTSMIHDATPLTHPDCHQRPTIELFQWFVEHTIPKLAAVIVPSQAVKQDLITQVGMRSTTIEVIHHGVDEDFFEASPEQIATARRTYGLPDEFVLFVGSMEPRKNLIRLAEAHAQLPESLQARCPLVVVGSAGWHNDEIRTVLEKSKHVRLVGYVSRALLPAVYACASLFVFPSLYEGFGMPLLEAMAAGTPVITSSISAMPEVVGEAGVTVDPYDTDEIRDALRAMLEDVNAAALLGARGRDRARNFTWERTAALTWEFLEKAAGRKP
jgi:alpha-1,3-rhamnosyl/mannosyltransferase